MYKKYWVLWTYVANYSGLIEVVAESGEDAVKRATHMYSDKFQKEAKVYVFDHEPVFTKNTP